MPRVPKGEMGYLDIYDELRTFQKRMRDWKIAAHVETCSRTALETLDGTLYLVESQLMTDAQGAN